MPGLAATPFGPWWFATDARVSALPAADVGGLALLLSHWWTSGDLRSASSTSTCCPASAKLAARLAMVVVFPSPA